MASGGTRHLKESLHITQQLMDPASVNNNTLHSKMLRMV